MTMTIGEGSFEIIFDDSELTAPSFFNFERIQLGFYQNTLFSFQLNSFGNFCLKIKLVSSTLSPTTPQNKSSILELRESSKYLFKAIQQALTKISFQTFQLLANLKTWKSQTKHLITTQQPQQVIIGLNLLHRSLEQQK